MALPPTRLTTLALVWLLAAEKGSAYPTSNLGTTDNALMDMSQPSYSFNGPAADNYCQPLSPGEYSMSEHPHSQEDWEWDPSGYSGFTSHGEQFDVSDNSLLRRIVDGTYPDTDYNDHSVSSPAPPVDFSNNPLLKGIVDGMQSDAVQAEIKEINDLSDARSICEGHSKIAFREVAERQSSSDAWSTAPLPNMGEAEVNSQCAEWGEDICTEINGIIAKRTLTSSRPVSRQPTSPSLLIFDREHKRLQKDRAAADPTSSREVDYLRDEVARQLVDRLRDIKRRFPTLVELGAHSGHLRRHVNRDLTDRIVQCDLSSGILYRDQHEPTSGPASASTAPFDRNGGETEVETNASSDLLTDIPEDSRPVDLEYRVVDEEDNPFPENSLDAVVSNLSLHWVNDLPGALIQIRRSLVPDGMFLGAMVGGDSLFELRTSLQLAELEREGGMSPRVSPMTDPRDMSDLLARAGFALTTVDVDEIVVNYPSALHVMQDLRAMGESNAIIRRRPYLPRDTLMAATSIYQALHGNEDGTVPATFQIVFMIGWKPDPSQPKPKARGSATVSLKDALQ
ncbi:hypothetical protein H4R33_005875 [Dimargaris cristalligena]|nr:hypothetical protein H4R33_005875 [Dimargaris cristalligena]